MCVRVRVRWAGSRGGLARRGGKYGAPSLLLLLLCLEDMVSLSLCCLRVVAAWKKVITAGVSIPRWDLCGVVWFGVTGFGGRVKSTGSGLRAALLRRG